jgi:hypothetical protein
VGFIIDAEQAGGPVNGNGWTKANWYEVEPTPMESTANVGTASLVPSRSLFFLRAQSDRQDDNEVCKSVASGLERQSV